MGSVLSYERKQRLSRFAHFLSGMLILVHGLDRYDAGRSLWPAFMGAGILIVLLAGFHARLARTWPGIDGVFFLIEALLSLAIMIEFMDAGKRGLPYMYLLAAIAQVCAAWITWRRRSHANVQPH